MKIVFEDAALEELYVSGTTANSQYRKLAKDVVKQYVKVVNYIRAARRIEDLYCIKSLHYEKKKGDLNGVDAVWINRQYRLLFNSSPDEEGIVVNALFWKYRSIMNKESLTPFVATHPGEMIKDELKERNMTQKQLAAESGIKASVLSETINGKRSVSLNVAVALEKVLRVPADVWMNMQTQYDLDTANIATRGNEKETVEVIIPVHDRNLLKEIARKFGWACMF